MNPSITGNVSALFCSPETDANNFIVLEQAGVANGRFGLVFDIRTLGLSQIAEIFTLRGHGLRDGLHHHIRAVYLPNDARAFVDRGHNY